MKKLILCFALVSLISICFSISAVANDSVTIYYLDDISFDTFLNSGCTSDIFNEKYIQANTYTYWDEPIPLNDGYYMFEEIKDLFSNEKILSTLHDYNTEIELKQYKIFIVNTQSDYELPKFIWLDTSEGYYIIKIEIDDQIKSDIVFKYTLLSPEESIEQFWETQAKVFVNDNEIDMDYAVIRYKGTLLSIRSLAESLGITVEWIENENAVMLSADKKMLKIIVGEDDVLDAYNMETNKRYSLTGNIISVPKCIWRDERIVLDSSQITRILQFFYENDFIIRIDNANSRINVSKQG